MGLKPARRKKPLFAAQLVPDTARPLTASEIRASAGADDLWTASKTIAAPIATKNTQAAADATV